MTVYQKLIVCDESNMLVIFVLVIVGTSVSFGGKFQDNL
jgi:hypothetical protein